MNLKCFLGFFFFSINVFVTLFSYDFQDKILADSIDYIQTIVTEAPEIIKRHENNKFYLNEDRIYSMGEGSCFLLTDEGNIPLHKALIFSDDYGSYLSMSIDLLLKKLFKNVCYDCKYEWDGGAFTIRCPVCKSKNIGNVPNW